MNVIELYDMNFRELVEGFGSAIKQKVSTSHDSELKKAAEEVSSLDPRSAFELMCAGLEKVGWKEIPNNKHIIPCSFIRMDTNLFSHYKIITYPCGTIAPHRLRIEFSFLGKDHEDGPSIRIDVIAGTKANSAIISIAPSSSRENWIQKASPDFIKTVSNLVKMTGSGIDDLVCMMRDVKAQSEKIHNLIEEWNTLTEKRWNCIIMPLIPSKWRRQLKK